MAPGNELCPGRGQAPAHLAVALSATAEPEVQEVLLWGTSQGEEEPPVPVVQGPLPRHTELQVLLPGKPVNLASTTQNTLHINKMQKNEVTSKVKNYTFHLNKSSKNPMHTHN